jgi:hypothetical protein
MRQNASTYSRQPRLKLLWNTRYGWGSFRALALFVGTRSNNDQCAK